MLDTIITEVVQQAPSLAALVWIVNKFIRAGRECTESHRDLVKQGHEIQRSTNQTIRENSVAMERLSATIQISGSR